MTEKFLVVEKGGSRTAHRAGRDYYTLQVCKKGFGDKVFFEPEQECKWLIEFLSKRLPKFQFELARKEDYVDEQVIGGVTYVFRKRHINFL